MDDVNDSTTVLFDVTSVVTTYATRRHVDPSYLRLRAVVNTLLPIIFGAGVAGNALNAVLLTRRRGSSHNNGGGGTSGRPTAFERSATAGLVALSASDLAFCLVGFAEVLFVGSPPRTSWRSLARLYYDTYYVALMNLFLFSSTWLIALVSVERCLAVCYPFRAGALIRVRRTVAAHVVVFAVSAILNVPLFLRSTIHSFVICPGGRSAVSSVVNSTVATVTMPAMTTSAVADEDDPSCAVLYYARPSTLSVSRPGLLYVHKVVWFTLGTFLPLLLIVYSNLRLIREICSLRTKSSAAVVSVGVSSQSRSTSKASLSVDKDKSSTITLTLTLIAIGVCFLLLVCPSMAIQFWRFASYSGYGGDKGPPPKWTTQGRSEAIAIVVTNLTQAIKFSSNFLLYCVVSRSFRRTFRKLFRARRCGARDGGLHDREGARPACNAALIGPSPADDHAADTCI